MEHESLGDYKLLKLIGQGTLGKVYLAEHRFIKTQYVVKVLPEELASDRNFIQRFEDEIAQVGTLKHPHIVKVHNVSFAEGRYFLVTDCIVDSIGETTNLAQYMSGRKERLREDELFRLLNQIADALDYAHAQKIAHLTLKLSNILIGKGKPGIEVFLSDFGLAKVVGTGAIVARAFKTLAEVYEEELPLEIKEEEKYRPYPIDAQKLSRLGHSFLQTYAFLAPEQKTPFRSNLTGREADIYAFGVLTYYLIAGVFPEGMFEMPSNVASEYTYNWNAVVAECLQALPHKRPQLLAPLLEGLKQGELKTPMREIPPIRPQEPSTREKPITAAPIIEKSAEEMPAPKEEKLVAVQATPIKLEKTERKGVESATSPAMNPPKDIQYEQKLSAMYNREPVVTQYHPEEKVATKVEPIHSEMIVIPEGQYFRGSNEGSRDESPRHKVTVDSFAIDIHPVTNEQFVRFLEHMGGEKDANYNDLIRLKEARIHRRAGKLSIESGYAKHPVVGVTWYGAVAYAKWLGKRLPTEAEWEIAASVHMQHQPYPTGDNIEKNQANFFSSDTTPVMSYAPNDYGLYDLVGNVYEWCQDWYGYNYYDTSEQEPNNPKGPVQGVYRVLRGGCWKSLKEDLRSPHRHRNNPGTVNGTYGFRCAADA